MSIPFTDDELQPAVERCIQKIEPMLALDGGSIKLLTIKNHIIYVQLQGACVGCPSSSNTLKYGVEKKNQRRYTSGTLCHKRPCGRRGRA